MDGVSRARWVAWSTAFVLIVGSVLALSGSAAMMPRSTQPTSMTAEQLKADGDRRLAAGDVSGALQAYDEALLLDRDDLGLYYRAGVALSHLGDREQAIALFLWVVRMGPPDREEVRVAREWLEKAQALPPEPRSVPATSGF